MAIRDRVRELRRVRAGDLIASPKNWRTHPDGQRAALAAVLEEVGYAGALLAYETPAGLELIDGHLRAETTPDDEVPVLVLDVDAAEAAKLLATYDPLGAMAGADAARLDALLREVSTGSDALRGLFAELKDGAPAALPTPGAGGDGFDATPQEDGPTRTRAGELWVIGGKHRLLVGDCTDGANVGRLMGGEKVTACVSDPPYGIGFDTDYTRFTVQRHHNINHGGSIKGDDKPFDPAPFLEYKTIVLWGANCFSSRLPLGTWLVWDKRFDNGEAWLADAEVAWMKGGSGVYIYKETTQGFVRSEPVMHPTQKPVGVMQWCIEKSKAAGTVYDPFLGSGTTLVAAHRLGRTCYGCEIDLKYADVILRRAEAEGLTCELAEKAKEAPRAGGKKQAAG